MKTLRKIALFLLLLFSAFVLFALSYYFIVTADARLDAQKLVLSDKNVCVYDKNHVLTETLAVGDRRITTAIKDIPLHTRSAFVSAEDKRFYSHNGFDVKRIVKAAVKNVFARSFQQGASTISQQLIKNTHLSHEKTVERKLKEWKLTRALEKNYSKDEILERYLNVIYFGHNCFGIHAAARFYFGKEPYELDLADSALLAGLVKSPNNYSPFKNPERCKQRKAIVLRAMVNNGVICERDAAQALQKPLPTKTHASKENDGYVQAVFDELSALAETHGFTVGGKIEIDTYLDENLQKRCERLVSNHEETDIAISCADVGTGGIKAYVSTVGNIKRLPASLLKPLLVYAPCLEERIISPATPILDEQVNYGGYTPHNYDDRFHGYVSVRESLAKSLNIPAVKLLETLTPQKGVQYLKKLNLSVDKDDETLALALGGMKNGFSLNELIGGYTALAHKGVYSDLSFISKVRINGVCVYNRKQIERTVFRPSTAYLTTDMLRTAATEGTAKKLRSLPMAIAAKTGTAGSKNGNTDAYALSYTTKDIAGVWLGNADNTPIEHTGGGLPCNYLYEINEQLQDDYQRNGERILPFEKPKEVVCVTLDKDDYYDRHTLSLADINSPPSHRMCEWFENGCIPLKTSTSFTKPSIVPPSIRYENGRVCIQFEKERPTYYTYKVERYDYATHTTLFIGALGDTFIDENVLPNKNYVYSVTPIYNGKEGEKIVLPAISTKRQATIPKEWWR